MQILVYLFIAVAATAIGGAAYYGLLFTPIESGLLGLGVFCFALTILEHGLRRRAERRLDAAFDDLSRLLGTHVQAGQTLGQRVNALSEIDAANRLEGLEADVAVLGSVVQEMAESIAGQNPSAQTGEQAHNLDTPGKRAEKVAFPAEAPSEIEPVIPVEVLRQALAENRLVFHAQPVLTLPERRIQAYDLVPRLALEGGELADPADFMPLRGGQDLIRQIEWAGLEEAVTLLRRTRTHGHPMTLNVPLSRASLKDAPTAAQLLSLFGANRVVAPSLILAIPDRDWLAFGEPEWECVHQIAAKGISFCIADAKSLKRDFSELQDLGVTEIRADAGELIGQPVDLTDARMSELSQYLAAFGIVLCAENVTSENQMLWIAENGIHRVKGPFVSQPVPISSILGAKAPVQHLAPQRAAGA